MRNPISSLAFLSTTTFYNHRFPEFSQLKKTKGLGAKLSNFYPVFIKLFFVFVFHHLFSLFIFGYSFIQLVNYCSLHKQVDGLSSPATRLSLSVSLHSRKQSSPIQEKEKNELGKLPKGARGDELLFTESPFSQPHGDSRASLERLPRNWPM